MLSSELSNEPQLRAVLINDCPTGVRHRVRKQCNVRLHHDCIKEADITTHAFAEQLVKQAKDRKATWTQWVDIVLYPDDQYALEDLKYLQISTSNDDDAAGTATTTPGRNSAFLDLSLEVRNAIYDAVLASDTIEHDPGDGTAAYGVLSYPYAAPPALARTCRQVR